MDRYRWVYCVTLASEGFEFNLTQVSQSTHGILRKLLHDLDCETWAKLSDSLAENRINSMADKVFTNLEHTIC